MSRSKQSKGARRRSRNLPTDLGDGIWDWEGVEHHPFTVEIRPALGTMSNASAKGKKRKRTSTTETGGAQNLMGNGDIPHTVNPINLWNSLKTYQRIACKGFPELEGSR